MTDPIVVATPHHRHDRLVQDLSRKGWSVTRVRSPETLTVETLEQTGSRYIFFPHWSWRIPREIYASFECVIFHMTDLPFGRGGSPLQNLILRGYQETVLTALRCVEELDAGPIYLKRPLSLQGTAEEILQRAADLTEIMIEEILTLDPRPTQQSGAVTSFQRRRPEDGNLSSRSDLQQVYDFIRMLDADGYPSAFLETEHFRVEFTKADLQSDAVLANARIVMKSDD